MSTLNFLRRIVRFLWHAVDNTRRVLHLFLLILIFALLGALFLPEVPVLPRSAALVLAPKGDVVEELRGDPVDRAFEERTGESEPQARLKDLIDSVRHARDDSRISALVLDLSDMRSVGLSKLQEVAREIDAFKESGKKVIAVGDYFTRNQYYLAAHAHEIYMHPMGIVYIDGYGRYRTFYKEAIDTLLIDWNVFREGTHKSYAEPYMRDDMSREDREASLVWLESLWSSYQEDVTNARELEEGSIAAYIDQFVPGMAEHGGNSATLALSAGLVDALHDRDEMRAQLIEIAGEDKKSHSFKQVNHETYIRAVRALGSEENDQNVGVIIASGSIVSGNRAPGTIGGESTAKLIRDARFDDSVKSVVLRVDSGGGEVFASEIIRRELEMLQLSGKPLVVSMSSVAASGGYWISMGADEIWASPSTLTGSIGVVAMFPTFQRSLDRLGVHVDGVGTSWLAGQFRFDTELSEEARQMINLGIRQAYEEFITRVAESRNQAVEDIDRIAQGRVWSGADAQKLGLVDQLGSLEEAIEAAADRAGIAEEYGVRYIERELSFSEALALRFAGRTYAWLSRLGVFSQPASPLQQALKLLREDIVQLVALGDPRSLYAYCFCSVD